MRGMAYSKDLREKVMEYRGKGHTQEETSRIFGVSVSAIKDWEKKVAETGSVVKKELNRTYRKYEDEKMRELIASEPDLYLYEIAERFAGGTVGGVRDALKRLGITRKKRR
jgi:transposase